MMAARKRRGNHNDMICIRSLSNDEWPFLGPCCSLSLKMVGFVPISLSAYLLYIIPSPQLIFLRYTRRDDRTLGHGDLPLSSHALQLPPSLPKDDSLIRAY